MLSRDPQIVRKAFGQNTFYVLTALASLISYRFPSFCPLIATMGSIKLTIPRNGWLIAYPHTSSSSSDHLAACSGGMVRYWFSPFVFDNQHFSRLSNEFLRDGTRLTARIVPLFMKMVNTNLSSSLLMFADPAW